MRRRCRIAVGVSLLQDILFEVVVLDDSQHAIADSGPSTQDAGSDDGPPARSQRQVLGDAFLPGGPGCDKAEVTTVLRLLHDDQGSYNGVPQREHAAPIVTIRLSHVRY